MRVFVLLLVIFAAGCEPETPAFGDFYVSDKCQDNNTGWRECFQNCTTTKLSTLSGDDPDDFVYACSQVCDSACTKRVYTYRYMYHGANKPCTWAKGTALLACKAEGYRP